MLLRNHVLLPCGIVVILTSTVMRSRFFDVFAGEMKKDLLFLRHILETTARGSPTSALARTVADKHNDKADESDSALDVDDNPFLMPPVCQEDAEDKEDND